MSKLAIMGAIEVAPEKRAQVLPQLLAHKARCLTAKAVEGVNAMSRLASAATKPLRAPLRSQRQPKMKAFFVGLDFETRKAIDRQLLTCARIQTPGNAGRIGALSLEYRIPVVTPFREITEAEAS